ncbi:glutathione S-transferase N-terminal domain-containing protein [Laribacter hongkongensis]|uniref:Glutathione transferase n=1 Tax=Laribacter hongkongensis (strain HLHK9) TaxID=557598 RepID=C1DCU0_LARHH|nr:glutathione binding-like protein [Laribacter hongkongensis]ACO73575.1 Putative glutathione transferase [Laribacter hongkongensis HLHK9]MCG8993435.1 glutathione S-transferase N-terminal domain-containing protein [Laribacter hongkongensis]MCG8999414.1 glutathione S-transferase N-terminal domain-containing protein [Laribacter hongkongensis]MCG9000383.1 glutathione S-transferase N-terminal domain-containing protein [Laribacter hongkongensis]MCG9004002.1 glutathione S-transferase N-terminal doma
MIDLYYWTTPNGHKISIFLEEAGLDYTLHPVDIGRGEQFDPAFLAIAPNNRIPAIVDRSPADGGEPLSVFESGAILLYLADKTGRFIPAGVRGRTTVLEWLFWQMAGFGPMLGQNHHFSQYAPEPVPYAIERYRKETERLYGVLDRQLARHEWLAGAEYSIADMASYPWAVPHEKQGIDLADYPQVARWHAAMAARPAVQRAYDRAEGVNPRVSTVDDEAKKHLFGQGRR